LTFTFAAREGAAFTVAGGASASVDGITYTLAGASDPPAFNESIAEVTPALASGLPSLADGWEYHTFRLSNSVDVFTRGFLRLTIAPDAEG
jgi:hypothetical protein